MKKPARLLTNSAWNLAGNALPLLVAVLTIPWLIKLIGLERFGFIALAWVLVGYASIIDLGIGRAVIRTMATRLASGDARGAADSGQAGLLFLVLLGLIAGLAFAALAPVIVSDVLVVSAALRVEATDALLLLAISIPLVMLTGGYIGVLSAHQDFKALNLIRGLLSVLGYLMPLGVALVGKVSLPWLMATVLALRLLGTLMYAGACWRGCAFRLRWAVPAAEHVRELFSLGGWMTVSNIVGPLITYLDRLLVGALVPLRLVGLYSLPYDLLTRLMLVPHSLLAAYFPRAAGMSMGTLEAQSALFNVTRWLFVAMVPIVAVVVALAHPAMVLWLGAEAGPTAATVLQILAVGVLFNAVAQGPALMILAAGHPRKIAILHLFELPVVLVLVWWLTSSLGIVGTALAASLRFALDALAVGWMTARDFAVHRWSARPALLPVLLAACLLAVAQGCREWGSAAAVATAALLVFGAYAWRYLLLPSERTRILALLQRSP